MSESRDYKHLKCVVFGRELITSGDLDPVYVAIRNAPLKDNAQMSRLLVAYWCLYHLGAAARLSELSEKQFWPQLGLAARNVDSNWLPHSAGGRWPRGTERRHWRGQQAVNSYASVLELARGKAEALVDYWGSSQTFVETLTRVRRATGFGPWIGFKVADMLERVAGYPVSFADCELEFYEEPRRGAALYLVSIQQASKAAAEDFVAKAVSHLLQPSQLGLLKAPPDRDRRVNVQEIETVLCKWKSHLNGHYAIGKDTREVSHGLQGWGDLAESMRTQVNRMVHSPIKEA